MARDDWFRNTEWSAAIETQFFAKLSRARDRQQPLRIQASILSQRCPEVALRLLDKYFEFGDHFDHAQAHVDRARAYLALGDTERAITAYEAALARESEYPNLLTQAWLDLSLLTARLRITSRFHQALRLLEQHQPRLMFPVDHFRWHAAHAFIFSAQGRSSLAREHARRALDFAALDDSGFRYHPTVGLVGDQHEDIREQLSAAT